MPKTANHRFTAVAKVEGSETHCFVGLVYTQNELSIDLAGDTFDDAFEDPSASVRQGLTRPSPPPRPLLRQRLLEPQPRPAARAERLRTGPATRQQRGCLPPSRHRTRQRKHSLRHRYRHRQSPSLRDARPKKTTAHQAANPGWLAKPTKCTKRLA